MVNRTFLTKERVLAIKETTGPEALEKAMSQLPLSETFHLEFPEKNASPISRKPRATVKIVSKSQPFLEVKPRPHRS